MFKHYVIKDRGEKDIDICLKRGAALPTSFVSKFIKKEDV